MYEGTWIVDRGIALCMSALRIVWLLCLLWLAWVWCMVFTEVIL